MRVRGTVAAVTACAVAITLPTGAGAGTQDPTESLGKSKGLQYMRAKFPTVVSQAGPLAQCASGREVTGGGGSVSGDPAAKVLNETYPGTDGSTGWHAEGTAFEGITTVTAWAVCGTVDVVYQTHQSALPDNSALGASSPCPSFYDPTGGGVGATGAGINIVRTQPMLPPSTVGWASLVRNRGMNDTLVDSYSVCSNSYTTRYRSATEPINKESAGKAVAMCKKSEAVLGGGFETLDGGIATYDAHAIASRPWDSKDRKKVPDDGWFAKTFNEAGHKVQVASYAVCMKPSG